MAGRENHHLMANADMVADSDFGTKIEKATDVDRAVLPNNQVLIEISAATNTRCAPDHRAVSNLKTGQAKNSYAQACAYIDRQEGK